ncbi:MAG: penicillin-binding protein 2 [Acidimicrobiales bacterium]
MVGWMITLLFVALFVRLWTLQVVTARVYQVAAQANSHRLIRTPAPRGLIFDRSGTVLAGDQAIMTVVTARDEETTHPAVVAHLAAVLGETQSQVEAALTDPRYSPYQPIPVAIKVPIRVVVYLAEHASEFPGVSVDEVSERTYPSGPLAAQTLGYLGPITTAELTRLSSAGYTQNSLVGQTGLEASYQHWLRGKDGLEQLEVNAAGATVSTRQTRAPAPGDDLVTTLDAGLQSAVESSLAQHIHALDGTVDPTTGRVLNPASGAAIVMNPNDGSVLAMASFPSYNPALWNGGISQANYSALTSASSHDPLVNRAIQGLYTPGSTFKLATATAALNTGLILPGTVINDTGTFTIPNCHGGCTFHNAGYEALGPLSISKAIAASDDVFFYNLGYDFYANQGRYGPTPIQDTAAAYGLGRLTGIPLPGEARGRVDSPAVRAYLHAHYPKAFPNASWYAGDNLEMAFGQGGTVVTPIELAQAYSTFANGGTRYQPRLVAAVVKPSGRLVRTFPPKVLGHVALPASTRGPMLSGFEGAVSQPYGTAYPTFLGFPLARFPVAGKTGTASQTGQYPTALFVAMAPANAPRYVVVVVVDQAGYGVTGAAPVARNILSYLMAHPPPPVRTSAP